VGSSTDVVVIGGGCAGTATAYFLTRAGLKVTLLERDALASGCSSHGTGVSRLNFRDTDNTQHASLSRKHVARLARIIPVLEDETGMDVQYQRAPGMTIPLTDEAWERMVAIGSAEGHKILTGDAARQLEPGLGPDIPGVVWEPYRPKVTAHLLAAAYAKAAVQRGAEVRLRTPAVGLEMKNGRVVGVKTANETIPCTAAVLAMGVWSPEASDWLGIRVPVKPIKGEALRLVYNGPRSQHVLTPEGLKPGYVEQGHLIFRLDGMVSAGSTVEDAGFDQTPTESARERIMRMAVHLWPSLADAKVSQHVTGLRPIPEDGLPMLGPVPGMEGAFILVGHSAVSRSALYAEITTDLLMTGTTNAIDSIEPFLMKRFLERSSDDNVYGVIREAREFAPTIAAGQASD
jgi:glycine oxidase